MLATTAAAAAIAQGPVQRLVLDILYQLQKDAGRVLLVTAIGAVAPSLVSAKSSTIILGVMALAASVLGTLLTGGENGVAYRGAGVALLSAVLLLAAALFEHVRPRADPPVIGAPSQSARGLAHLGKRSRVPLGVAAAVSLPVWLAHDAQRRQREREEATRGEIVSVQRELKSALELLKKLGGLATDQGSDAQ
jgi:hypothetical protein